MKKIVAIVVLGIFSFGSFAQVIYMTRTGQVSFSSETPMENIAGVNNEVTSMINSTSGEIVFALLVKSFHFEKALMEEHFNENYMESSKLPKSTFQGKITNLSSIDFAKDGNYPATVEGDITIHGVKQHIISTGTISIKKKDVTVLSTFNIKVEDYKIDIPSLVAEKIAKTITVIVNCAYKPKS